jgi:hypothetical protein
MLGCKRFAHAGSLRGFPALLPGRLRHAACHHPPISLDFARDEAVDADRQRRQRLPRRRTAGHGSVCEDKTWVSEWVVIGTLP